MSVKKRARDTIFIMLLKEIFDDRPRMFNRRFEILIIKGQVVLKHSRLLRVGIEYNLAVEEVCSTLFTFGSRAAIPSSASRPERDRLVRDSVKKAERVHDGEVVLVIVRK